MRLKTPKEKALRKQRVVEPETELIFRAGDKLGLLLRIVTVAFVTVTCSFHFISATIAPLPQDSTNLKISANFNVTSTALRSNTVRTLDFITSFFSFGPQQEPDRQQKKEERGLKQRRKQKEAAQGDPEPKKGNQEKEKKIK
jgi:hypothetical protein